MVSRVSLGHSGRPLEADGLTWACYLGVIVCAVLRVAELARVEPRRVAADDCGRAHMARVFGAWAWRLPSHVDPRADVRR